MRSLIHMCTFIACSRPASNLFERLWYGHGTSSIAQTSTPNRFAILIRPRLSVLQRTSEKSEQIRKDNGIPLDKTRFPRARRLAKADGPYRPAGNAL
jgi:hypothetical protein